MGYAHRYIRAAALRTSDLEMSPRKTLNGTKRLGNGSLNWTFNYTWLVLTFNNLVFALQTGAKFSII